MRITKIIPFAMVSLLLGCGGSSGGGRGSIDISEYLPQQDVTKSYLRTINNGESSGRQTYEEVIHLNDNQLTYSIDDQVVKQFIIQEEKIIAIIKNENNLSMERYLDIGDRFFTQTSSNQVEEIVIDDVILGTKTTESTKVCKLNSQLEKLDTYSIPYQDEILKFKCIEEKSVVTEVRDDLPEYINLSNGEVKTDNDISYFYLKKGIGLIADINDDCVVEEGGITKVDDTAQACQHRTYVYNFFLD